MKKIKGLCLLLVIAAAAILTASCTNDSTDSSNPGGSSPGTHAGSGDYPQVITDFVERKVEIKNRPQRIVSLAPGITEILFELGLGDTIVGVTDFDDYPAEVLDIPKVGDFQGPNMEAIAGQRPDIIFASTLSGKDSMEALQRLGIPVLMLEARDIDQIFSSIQIIADITEKRAEGAKLTADMKSRMEEIRNRISSLPKPKVFYIVDLNGNFTAGKGTFIDQLITLAGGQNIAGDVDGWAQYSMEKLVQDNPAVIITAAHAGNMDKLSNMPGYRDTDAVKNNRIHVISDDNIISRTSYRIVQGLEEIASFLHPDAF